MHPIYTVFIVGGKDDGKTLAIFKFRYEAIRFAQQYLNEHEGELDPVFGGIGIVDFDGNVVEW